MIDFRLLKKPFTFRKHAYAINCDCRNGTFQMKKMIFFIAMSGKHRLQVLAIMAAMKNRCTSKNGLTEALRNTYNLCFEV